MNFSSPKISRQKFPEERVLIIARSYARKTENGNVFKE
jgi:hypothetical protein